MDLLPALQRLYESDHPSTGFLGMAEALHSAVGLRHAAHIILSDRSVRDQWPESTPLSDDLIDTALHVLRTEVFPVGSEFPFDAAAFPGCDMLIIPVRRAEERRAACLLVAGSGAFGEDLQPWEQLSRAIGTMEARHARLAEAEGRCSELQQRIEESEALHTLGLAANRTLDLDEVLNLVARFTRTLLGAHYVTVQTAKGGDIHDAASIGLRNADSALADPDLPRAVVDAERPLILGGPESDMEVERFPFHAAEGMKRGVGIPLSLFGDTFGALIVGYRREYEVTPRDIRLALTLAGHAAVAISNARLHETVEERSRELQVAYEELNGLTQAKERFFASINHELRNPLGAILGYQTLLLDGTLGEIPASARPFLEKANRAAQTLRTLVDDILDLSKLAAGKMEVELRPCSLGSILDGVLNTIQPHADQKGVGITVAVPAGMPEIVTDPDRVQQILVNLLSNAVKFTGDRGVEVSAERLNGGNGAEAELPIEAVEIRVRDSGQGIAPEDLRRIFEEYEQVKGTRGGTGLGLPISRRLARALGGELYAESEVGMGSTFVLRLPLGQT